MLQKLSAFGILSTAFLILFLISPLTAQTTFQRTYGGTSWDEGGSVARTTDGGYVVTGYTGSFGAGHYDVYLVKTDALGDTMWTRTFGGAVRDGGFSVARTTDGGYVITGCTGSFGAGEDDAWLIKTDASGDTIWTRTFGGADEDCGYSTRQTADGGYVVAGWTLSFGAGGQDVWLIKTDASGDTIWTRTYGGADEDFGRSVAQTADSGYVIAGYTECFGAGASDVWLLKTDAWGDTVWTRTFGGPYDDYGYSVAQTTDGGYVIAGYTWSFGAGSWDVYLVKTDAAGDTLWTRTFGSADMDMAFSVAQTEDGGYVIAGWTSSFGAGVGDVYLVKTDAAGDTLWTRTYGGADWDMGYSTRQTEDGGYVVTGRTLSFGAGEADVWLIKTDSAGNAAAIAEPQPPVAHKPATATIARAVLHMPETEMTNARYPMTLLDAAGRCVMELAPGENDVSRVAPGVYFVFRASGVKRDASGAGRASSVRKVILTR